MKKKIKLLISFIVLCAILIAGMFVTLKALKFNKESVPVAKDLSAFEDSSTQNMTSEVSTETMPPELNLNVPFYSQAPLGNWDYPWQESCEEASSLLVSNAYYNHNWTKEEFNQQILKLVEWEINNFGAYEHTTMKQTEVILNKYLNLKTVIHENPSYLDIQTILNKGHLIIAPLAGKEIANPYFKNGGPNYHVLIIKGYKAGEKIITNDVGTSHGENYVYDWKILGNALHDYDEPIDNGAKRIIEVLPPKN